MSWEKQQTHKCMALTRADKFYLARFIQGVKSLYIVYRLAGEVCLVYLGWGGARSNAAISACSSVNLFGWWRKQNWRHRASLTCALLKWCFPRDGSFGCAVASDANLTICSATSRFPLLIKCHCSENVFIKPWRSWNYDSVIWIINQ